MTVVMAPVEEEDCVIELPVEVGEFDDDIVVVDEVVAVDWFEDEEFDSEEFDDGSTVTDPTIPRLR
jgi:hypothetical protein